MNRRLKTTIGAIMLLGVITANVSAAELFRSKLNTAIIPKTKMFLKEIEFKTEEYLAAEKAKQEMLEKVKQDRLDLIDSIIEDNNRKHSVSFNPNDLNVKSNISADELYEVLCNFSGGSLAQYAWALKEAEDMYDVNVFFLTALVAEESAWGKSERAIYQNNLTGHAVYNSNATGTYFNSPEESIYNTAELIRYEYLTPGGHSYNGESIYAVNTRYCLTEDSSATDTGWATRLSEIAYDLESYYHTEVKELKEVPEQL